MKGVTMSELVITESTFNLIKSVGEPSTNDSFDINSMMLLFLFIIIALAIFSYYQKLRKNKKPQSILSSSKEVVVYEEKLKEDKKTNQTKQNIYNKYYFNVYVKQPYNKNGKTNTKAGYKNQKTYKQSDDDFIDAEVIV